MSDFKDFKSLRASWYQILKDSGFKDIERENGSLKDEVDKRTLNRACIDKEFRIAYFEKASQALSQIAIEGTKEWIIWQLHSEGMSNRSIARRLGIHNTTIDFSIKKLRKKAGL